MTTTTLQDPNTQKPPGEAATAENVVTCYDFFDRVLPECGLLDMTDGMYLGDPATPYGEAQRNQIEWLLDEVRCGVGSRLLDIGCGNGTLLEAARRRGAEAVGVTISPPQVERCRRQGLDVRLLNYRNMGDEWNGRFDAIVANGSIEHFVQPADALENRGDAIYGEMFEICHRLLDPASPSRRFATTVIHRHAGTPVIKPEDYFKGPMSFRWGSPMFHYALLQRGFGGFFPEIGQLERCARGHFTLVREVDGTQDYHWTSEECFRRAWQSLWRWPTGPRIWRRLAGHFVRHPRHAVTMFVCLFVAESWQWQFRGVDPPTRLLRQTWAWRP